MRLILLIAALILYIPEASAECGTKRYVLSGVILEASGEPSPGAMIGAAWKEGGIIGGPALGRADAEGRYTISINFRTYSFEQGKNWYGCNGLLGSIMVSASDDTRYSPPTIITVENGRDRIVAQPIKLDFDIATGVPVEPGT